MGYGLTKGLSLNFGKEKRALLRSFVPKGKDPDYYHKTRRGLSYVSIPISSDSESKEVYNDSSSTTSLWNSNVSVRVTFESLLVNMVSASLLEDDKENTTESEELVQSDFDPWIKHLNSLWDIRFEQCKLPTEDKVI